ncbi:MAG: hypothetical protein IPK16_28900, partial [Anaerolineales bacterium]|nr:hypothetical protein [Anaerolineales bacterium]
MHVFATDRTYTGQHKVNSGIYDVGDYARNYGDSDQPLVAPEPVEQEPMIADIFTSKRRLSVIDYISYYFWKPTITTSAPTRDAAMITSEAPKSESIYYCWLYDWNTRTIDVLTRVRPAFALCEVRHDELSIVSPSARLSIALANIHEVRLWRWASAGAKITINVEIR